jgi:hypothetical protein
MTEQDDPKKLGSVCAGVDARGQRPGTLSAAAPGCPRSTRNSIFFAAVRDTRPTPADTMASLMLASSPSWYSVTTSRFLSSRACTCQWSTRTACATNVTRTTHTRTHTARTSTCHARARYARKANKVSP